MKWMLWVSLFTGVSLLGATEQSQETPKVDVFAGYSYVRENPSTAGASSFGLNGGRGAAR